MRYSAGKHDVLIENNSTNMRSWLRIDGVVRLAKHRRITCEIGIIRSVDSTEAMRKAVQHREVPNSNKKAESPRRAVEDPPKMLGIVAVELRFRFIGRWLGIRTESESQRFGC